VLILSYSQIAICTTTGAWASRKNKALVESNRRALAALRADGTAVCFQHVRAHAGHGMSERGRQKAGGARVQSSEFIRAQGIRSRGGGIYVPTDGGGWGHGSGVYATVRPAGRVTSRWIRCWTEGQRRGGEGGERRGRGEKTRG